MIDITSNPRDIDGFDKIEVYEFIHGRRFTIRVRNEYVDYIQDIEWNKQYNGVFDVTEFINGLNNVYRLDEFRLRNIPIKEYDINCIVCDKDLLNNIGPTYDSRRVYVVEIITIDKKILPFEFIKEKCYALRLPILEPCFIGLPERLKNNISILRMDSKVSSNRLCGGLVIKPMPSIFKDNKFLRFFMKPDHSHSVMPSVSMPEPTAKEFVLTCINPEKILELEKLSNIDPVAKRKVFKRFVKNYLLDNFGPEYESYFHSCAPILNAETAKEEFNKLIEQEISLYINGLLKNMNAYKYRERPLRMS